MRHLGDVELLALGAVDFHAVLSQLVTHAVGDDLLLVAEGARAVSVRASQILAVDVGQAYRCIVTASNTDGCQRGNLPSRERM